MVLAYKVKASLTQMCTLFYSILTEASDQNEPRDQYACCACGGATYDITFIGKSSFLGF